jgi:hypothetical protein
MARSNAASLLPARRNRARRATAGLVILSHVLPGCAVHGWRPVADAEVQDLASRAVRVDGDRGTVELASARLTYPYLVGRPTGGNGPVQVDVPPDARVGVFRCAGAPDEGRVRWAAAPDASRLVGCDVRIETARGSVALRVRGAYGANELIGDLLPCRDEGDRAECTGLVRVDLRQYEHVGVRERDVPLTVVATLGAVSLVTLGVVWVAGVLALSHME